MDPRLLRSNPSLQEKSLGIREWFLFRPIHHLDGHPQHSLLGNGKHQPRKVPGEKRPSKPGVHLDLYSGDATEALRDGSEGVCPRYHVPVRWCDCCDVCHGPDLLELGISPCDDNG